ncbi:hypothetical protein C8R47DRAFT_1076083 [Mycena vitilis]|nr:hypothetical protein C8R47DRAFT_1076083 [Mycena vitilis]
MPRVSSTGISKFCDTGTLPPMPRVSLSSISKFRDTSTLPPLPRVSPAGISEFCDTGSLPPLPRGQGISAGSIDDAWSRAAAARAAGATAATFNPIPPDDEWSWAAKLRASDRANARTTLKKKKRDTAVKEFNTNPLHSPRLCQPRHFFKAIKPVKARLELSWVGLRDNGASAEDKASGAMETGFLTTHLLSAFFGPTATFLGSKLVKASREDTPLVDSSRRAFGVHSGLNNDPSFQTDVKGAAVAMEEARAKVSLSGEQGVHRCEKYKTLTTGNSHGDGQMQPGVLVNGIISTGVLCALLPLGIHSLCRGGHRSPVLIGLFVNWAPNLFDFYTVYTQDFYKTYKHLRRPFLNSVFSACTFNLGPYTCALGHCKGGHLILCDCKLILEFPPGTTILIPSAAIFHSNIPISKGEHRYSFTQYTAGAFSAGWITGIRQRRSIGTRSVEQIGKWSAPMAWKGRVRV